MLIYKATLQLPMHTLSYLCACKVICFFFFLQPLKCRLNPLRLRGTLWPTKQKLKEPLWKKASVYWIDLCLWLISTWCDPKSDTFPSSIETLTLYSTEPADDIKSDTEIELVRRATCSSTNLEVGKQYLIMTAKNMQIRVGRAYKWVLICTPAHHKMSPVSSFPLIMTFQV